MPTRAGGLLEHRLAPIAGAVLATMFWSLGNLMAKASDLPGPQLAFWRVLFGAVIYQAIFRARGGRMTWAALRIAVVGGTAFGLSSALLFTALQTSSVASVTIITALQPVFLLPYAVRRLGERVDIARLVLTGLALTGTIVTVLAASSSGSWSLFGDVLAFIGMFAGCTYFVGTKYARATLGAIEYQAAALTVAIAVAFAGALVTGPGLVTPTVGDLWWALLIAIIPGTGHLLMIWSQKQLPVSTTATIALDVVVLSSIGAALLFGQELVPVQVAGMALVLVALALYVRRSSAEAIPDPGEIPVTPGE